MGLGSRYPGRASVRRVDGVGHRLAGAGLADVLDAGDEVADLAGTELVHREGVGGAHADLLDLVDGAGLHVAHARPGLQRALHHPDGADHAAVLVVGRVEDEGPQGRVGVARRWRHPGDDGVEELGHPLARLGRDVQDVRGVMPRTLLDLGA